MCCALCCSATTSTWVYSLTNTFSWHIAGTGKSNKMLTIFSQLAAISQMLLQPHFIFDGPNRPLFRQRKDCLCGIGPPLLEKRFQELLDAFGFSWYKAPGEAEAELAYFCLCGLVDAVVTPYNDALLFGAPSILQSVQPLSRDYGDVELYTVDVIEDGPSLDRGDLLFIALMSGADYNMGLPGCTVDVARRLAQYGFGRTLFQAVVTNPFVEFMEFHAKWRRDLFQVLERDPQHHLGQCHYGLTRVIDEECTEFPDPAILTTYLLPLTSWSDGSQPPVTEVTSHQPDLVALSTFCS
ncbi:hypothetical protein SCLCIDRAFT_122724 [Scleroderma citrinum Foug A]|uniref:XPG-I domain-containing protein n=1 Tax=Scleroderma citrinum Foug A TaxID=1036808 RepID=A0A0C2ZHN9_9AGAM|nr:hypothetical protein SCLCIDRAFT_122724 [Scleroderma citrinum Foug A]